MTNTERKRCISLSKERGDFVTDVSGYVVFWPNNRLDDRGAFTAQHLRWAADELDALNEPYNKILEGM